MDMKRQMDWTVVKGLASSLRHSPGRVYLQAVSQAQSRQPTQSLQSLRSNQSWAGHSYSWSLCKSQTSNHPMSTDFLWHITTQHNICTSLLKVHIKCSKITVLSDLYWCCKSFVLAHVPVCDGRFGSLCSVRKVFMKVRQATGHTCRNMAQLKPAHWVPLQVIC